MICCKYCILTKGLRGSEIKEGKKCFGTEEELFNHIEMEHDLVINRGKETEKEAFERVKKKNPRIGTENCQCPACQNKRKLKEPL